MITGVVRYKVVVLGHNKLDDHTCHLLQFVANLAITKASTAAPGDEYGALSPGQYPEAEATLFQGTSTMRSGISFPKYNLKLG